MQNSPLSGIRLDLGGTANDLVIGQAGGSGTAIGYSPAGQIAALTRSNEAYAWTGHYNYARGYTANGLNQYTAAGATGFGYDARGNLTSSGSSSYGYSKLNELKTAPGASMHYDPLGRLFEFNTSTWTRFYYTGGNIAAELANPSGTVLRRYVHGPGVDEPIVWYEGSGTGDRRWLQADERGSVVAVSDASGNAIAINRYDEFGIPQSGNVGRYQYTGQTWFPEVGLYNYKARWYSPTMGRFMQTDPIGYADGLNWYDYVGGDPVNNVDPTGMCVQVGNGSGGWLPPAVCPNGIPVMGGGGGGSGGVDFSMLQPKTTRRVDPDNSASKCFVEAIKQNGAALGLDLLAIGLNFTPLGMGAKLSAGLAIGAIGMSNTIGGMNPSRQDLNASSIGAAISGMLAGAAEPAKVPFPDSKIPRGVATFGAMLGVTSLALDMYNTNLDYKECMAR